MGVVLRHLQVCGFGFGITSNSSVELKSARWTASS